MKRAGSFWLFASLLFAGLAFEAAARGVSMRPEPVTQLTDDVRDHGGAGRASAGDCALRSARTRPSLRDHIHAQRHPCTCDDRDLVRTEGGEIASAKYWDQFTTWSPTVVESRRGAPERTASDAALLHTIILTPPCVSK